MELTGVLQRTTSRVSGRLPASQWLRKDQGAGGIVFHKNPLIHGFPWTVSDTIASKHVLLAYTKQPFRRYKGLDGALARTLETLRNSVESSAW